jgi:hypothetical protein
VAIESRPSRKGHVVRLRFYDLPAHNRIVEADVSDKWQYWPLSEETASIACRAFESILDWPEGVVRVDEFWLLVCCPESDWREEMAYRLREPSAVQLLLMDAYELPRDVSPPRPAQIRDKASTPPVVLRGPDEDVLVWGKDKAQLTEAEYRVIKALLDAWKTGRRLSTDELRNRTKDKKGNVIEDPVGVLERMRKRDPDWKNAIDMAGKPRGGYGLNSKLPKPTR